MEKGLKLVLDKMFVCVVVEFIGKLDKGENIRFFFGFLYERIVVIVFKLLVEL